jgi:hypothetical protein
MDGVELDYRPNRVRQVSCENCQHFVSRNINTLIGNRRHLPINSNVFHSLSKNTFV